MFKWYRDYISVLSREFYVYFGLGIGALIGVWAVLGSHWHADQWPHNEFLFLGLFMAAIFILSRAALLAAAYLVRRKLGRRAKPAISKKLQAQDRQFARKHRIFAFGYLGCWVLAKVLRQQEMITEGQYHWTMNILICALMAWIVVRAFRRKDDQNLKKGSLAASISRGSRYVLAVLIVLFVLEQLWLAHLLKRFPFN